MDNSRDAWDPRKLGWKRFIVKLYKHHKPDGGVLLLRLVLGILMLTAGWQKLGHMDMTVAFFSTLGFATWMAYMVAWLEFLGGIFITLGIFMKPTCVAFATQMAVIVWGTDATSSVIYFGHDYMFVLLVAFLALYLMGPGKYSIANLFWKDSKIESC